MVTVAGRVIVLSRDRRLATIAGGLFDFGEALTCFSSPAELPDWLHPPVDAVVLDFPRRSRGIVYRQLRQRYHGPVLALLDPGEVQSGLPPNRGRLAVLHRPFSGEELSASLGRVVGVGVTALLLVGISLSGGSGCRSAGAGCTNVAGAVESGGLGGNPGPTTRPLGSHTAPPGLQPVASTKGSPTQPAARHGRADHRAAGDRRPDDRTPHHRAAHDGAAHHRATDDRAADDRSSHDRAADHRTPHHPATHDGAAHHRAPGHRSSDDHGGVVALPSSPQYW